MEGKFVFAVDKKDYSHRFGSAILIAISSGVLRAFDLGDLANIVALFACGAAIVCSLVMTRSTYRDFNLCINRILILDRRVKLYFESNMSDPVICTIPFNFRTSDEDIVFYRKETDKYGNNIEVLIGRALRKELVDSTTWSLLVDTLCRMSSAG